MEKGVVVNLVAEKGFGFIRGSQGAQYFVHKSMLSEGLGWADLTVGRAVEFTPRQGRKGLEATEVKLVESESPFKSIDDIPGDYGLMSIVRGEYTNPDKNFENCDGLAFCGLGTIGGRFPNNPILISMLREMRAVFDRENKFWFLRADLVPSNLDRIAELVVTSKRERRNQIILKCVMGVLGTIFAIAAGAIIIGCFVLLAALVGAGGGSLSSPFRGKISRTGNVWVGGNRIT